MTTERKQPVTPGEQMLGQRVRVTAPLTDPVGLHIPVGAVGVVTSAHDSGPFAGLATVRFLVVAETSKLEAVEVDA